MGSVAVVERQRGHGAHQRYGKVEATRMRVPLPQRWGAKTDVLVAGHPLRVRGRREAFFGSSLKRYGDETATLCSFV